jgi:5-methyltetrahydrofolate--homocysteine methyltransferase
VLVFDGAMGTSIQGYDLTADDFGGESLEGCNDYLVITRPGRDRRDPRELPRGRLRRRGDRHLPLQPPHAGRVRARRAGARDQRRRRALAREVADRFSTPEQPRYVAGSIGPSGFLPSSSDPTLGNMRFDELVPLFAEQAHALVEGGVDVLLIETSQDILEVKAAIFGCREAIARGRPAGRAAGAGHARHLGPDAARHRHRRGADHAGVAAART